MANRHYGNLADVFKHLALAEVIATARPAEYWESHAGAATCAEDAAPTAERLHGIHTFSAATRASAVLGTAAYARLLHRINGRTGTIATIPGSPKIAADHTTDQTRRLLFCDTDADALTTIRKLSENPRIECVQDDGISVLRGAALMLSDNWAAGTLAFLDPSSIVDPTDSGISPLDLWCELANKGIPTLMWYGYPNAETHAAMMRQIQAALAKTLLEKKGAQRFEGNLIAPPDSILVDGQPLTQWGFGLLTMRLPGPVMEKMDGVLHGLESAYAKAKLNNGPEGSGAWKYARVWM